MPLATRVAAASVILTGAIRDVAVPPPADAALPTILKFGPHPGSAATDGIIRLGFSELYTQSSSQQLTQWMTDAVPVAGFRIIGRVDAGGPAALERNWTIASLADVPGEKSAIDRRTVHGAASIFTSYADFYASPALATAWRLPALAGKSAANLLDLTFHAGDIATAPYTPFPHAPGFGLAEPDAWETAGGGQDSANFELNGNYTDWFAPGAPQGLHDELDFIWSGTAIAATLQLSLLQTVEGKEVIVQLFDHGRLVYAGSPPPIQSTGRFQPGNPSIATINLANLTGADGKPVALAFNELHLSSAGGGFLVNGLALTMSGNSTVLTAGQVVPLSSDSTANPSRIVYSAPVPRGFDGTIASASGDGVLDISNFSLDRGDELVILKTDLIHLQITPANADNDLAIRFLDQPADLILLRGAGGLDVVASFRTLSVIGSNEVVLSRQALFS